MSSQSLKTELQDFVLFATHRIEVGDCEATVEDLVQQWRRFAEVANTVEDIQQGLRDKAAGLAEPVEQVFADIRQRLGLSG